MSSSNFFLFLYPESKSSVCVALIALQNRIEIHDSESVDLLKKYILGYGFGVLIWIKKRLVAFGETTIVTQVVRIFS